MAEAVAKPRQPGMKPDPGPGERLDARSQEPAVLSDRIAAHIVDTRFEDLGAETIAKCKHRVLDLIGCAIGGAPALGNAALVRSVKRSGGAPEATIIGYNVKAPVAQAALANGVISRSYDFEVMTVDMGKEQVPSHHSPTTCMTALALAERARASGRDFITDLTVGDDVAARLIAASGMDFRQGWDEASVFSAMGATAIAARALKLSPLQTRDALGICVDQLAGTVQAAWDGAMNWKLQQGRASRDAIMSAELAQDGWTGMMDPLLAPYGFYAQYSGGIKRPEVLSQNLGKTFYAEGYFKPYPACAATHSTIECALALVKANAIDPNAIEKITIAVPEPLLSQFVSKPYQPRRNAHCDANFSNQFMVANVLLHGSVRQEHYAESNLRSPALLNLVARSTNVAGRPGVASELTVVMKDGRVFNQQRTGPTSRSPLLQPSSYEEIVAKFRQQVVFSNYMKSSVADEIVERIDWLDREKDMADFMKLVTRDRLTSA